MIHFLKNLRATIRSSMQKPAPLTGKISRVLYHLRYPMLGIDNIHRVATGDIFIETHISDKGMGRKEEAVPLWKFYRLNELNRDHSNWFDPNIAAVIQAFESQRRKVTGNKSR
jgi:hypothetical protein